MRLSEYLRLSKKTQLEFSIEIAVTQVSVSRYVTGERIPERDVMARIVEVTKGAVTANDFYQAATNTNAANTNAA